MNEDIFGKIETPKGIAAFDQAAGGSTAIGLIVFLSTGIRIFTIVAGLYVFLNILLAGFDYITAGDNKAHQKVREKLTSSVLGLIVIVSAYTIAALIGLVFFGDPTFIINPTICGPEGC